MLKVKSVKTIGFVGNAKDVVTALTCPLLTSKPAYFYFNNNVYKIVSPLLSSTRVIVFSATDLMWKLEEILTLCQIENAVVYITDYHKLKKLGIKLNKQMLRYILACPVVFSTRHTARGLNKLLKAIDLVSNTPDYNNLTQIKKSIFNFKSIFSIRRYNK